ncbi:MAG TPA: hypothetical protein VKH37_04650, partial [Ferruginibacter sp.]|nr:hypothetical protein [Ferruginibacter sp.]
MNHLYKGKAKYKLVLATLLLLIAITLHSNGNSFHNKFFHSSLTPFEAKGRDTIPKNKLPSRPPDTSLVKKKVPDTSIITKIDTVHFKASKDSLDAPVYYHADDSMVLDVPGKTIYLYGKASNVKYLDNSLTAPHIEFNQRTNEVSAYLLRDSAGNVVSFAMFRQGDMVTQSDSVRFNMKTQKGITKRSYSQQGDEMYVQGDIIKKVSPDIFYASRAKFTTCNLDTP